MNKTDFIDQMLLLAWACSESSECTILGQAISEQYNQFGNCKCLLVLDLLKKKN